MQFKKQSPQAEPQAQSPKANPTANQNVHPDQTSRQFGSNPNPGNMAGRVYPEAGMGSAGRDLGDDALNPTRSGNREDTTREVPKRDDRPKNFPEVDKAKNQR